MDGVSVSALEVRFDDNTREIFDLADIEGKVYDRIDKDGNNYAEIEFYSGGKTKLYEGENINLFIDEEGYYTFDSKKSISAETKIYQGEVTGFEFLPLTENKKALVLEHIIVEVNGKEVHVPLGDERIKSINSKR